MTTETYNAAVEAIQATNLRRQDIKAGERALAAMERRGLRTPAELADLRTHLETMREAVEKKEIARRLLRSAK